MIDTEKSPDFLHDPHSIANRAVGVMLLAYFSPVFLVIACALLLRSMGATPIFVANRSRRDGRDTAIWQFRVPDEDDGLDRFLYQSRLNLLPQLVNVAQGDITITRALG